MSHKGRVLHQIAGRMVSYNGLSCLYPWILFFHTSLSRYFLHFVVTNVQCLCPPLPRALNQHTTLQSICCPVRVRSLYTTTAASAAGLLDLVAIRKLSWSWILAWFLGFFFVPDTNISFVCGQDYEQRSNFKGLFTHAVKRSPVATSEKWSIRFVAALLDDNTWIFFQVPPGEKGSKRWIMQLMSDLYSGCLNLRPYKFFIHFVHCKRILSSWDLLGWVIMCFFYFFLLLLSAWSQVWSASSSSTARMSRPISMTPWRWWLSPSRSCLRRRISQNPREDAWAIPTSGKRALCLNGERGTR